MKLSPTKIGYLREAPRNDYSPVMPTGPRKAMLNKLAKTGHVLILPAGYTRSTIGDAAIAEFDQQLSARHRAILDGVARGEKSSALDKGFTMLVYAGLIRISPFYPDRAELSDDAKAILGTT